MPIIENADLTTVSTEYKAYPEGTYGLRIKDSSFDQNNKNLIIESEITDAENPEHVGRTYKHRINMVDNSGKRNEIGLTTLKRYLETVFGKGSPESQVADSDPLHGHDIRVYLVVKSYKDKTTQEDREGNEVKQMFKA